MATEDAAASEASAAGREKTRMIASSAGRITTTGHIGGEVTIGRDAAFLDARLAVWQRLAAEKAKALAGEA